MIPCKASSLLCSLLSHMETNISDEKSRGFNQSLHQSVGGVERLLGCLNVTETNKDDDNDSESAMLYVVVVILFYSSAMILLVIKYLRRDKSDTSLQRFFDKQDPKRDSIDITF